MISSNRKFKGVKDFYPFYLSEHTKKSTRIFHFIGTTLFFVFLFFIFYDQNIWFIIPTILVPYFFAWIGHFGFEKNKPAAFKHPFLSLLCDFKLYFEIIIGKQSWGEK